MIKRLLSYIFLVSLSFWFSGCHTVPKTGRSSLSLVSEKKLAAASAQEFTKVKLEKPLSYNPDHNERVKRVGKRIAEVAKVDIPNADWEFVVFDDDDQINAFAMPGGKVAVFTGLLKVAKTDDELAIVIGHEVGHVAARHSNERYSQQVLSDGFLNITSLALSFVGLSGYEGQILLTVVDVGSELGVMLPYSRKHENEADHIGLLYAAEAGYDPHAAITFWERVEAMGEGDQGPPEFLSTHPAGKKRIRKLWILMPEAMEIYRNHQTAKP